MTKSIQDLRREKGYRSSKDFALALGVSPSSMSRYDKDPTLIPVKMAWAMADLLDCSIDEVLGRERVTSGKSALQEDYDSLGPESQALVREFIEFAKARDRRMKDDMRAEKELRFDRLCQFYERLFYQSLCERADFGEPVIFRSYSSERETFRKFVAQKVAEKRRRHVWDGPRENDDEDEEVINAVMASYERRHGSGVRAYGAPRITVEYSDGFPS